MSITEVKNKSTEELLAFVSSRVGNFPSLKAMRENALQIVESLGLPASKHEEYKHTPITRILEKNISFSRQNAEGGAFSGLDNIAIPGLQSNVLVFINGVFSKKHSSLVSPPSEITISSLEEAVENEPSLVMKHLAKYADDKADVFTAFNTASWESGVFIHVPAGKRVDKPVVIYNVNDTSKGQVITSNRNLFVVEKGGEATVIETSITNGAGNHFASVVTEAVVEETALLNWYAIQNNTGNQFLHETMHVHQADNSRVNTFTFCLDGKLVRNNLQLSLDGERIESHMFGLYLLHGNTLADNHTVVDHKKPNSFSNELYKGVIDGEAKGIFNGKIFVRPQAQKTNAFQANRNILLSEKASVNTKPQLEIWADDVKCSHGCTSGQLDEEAMFYLQSRGIGKDTARAMMLYAFTGELLQNVKDPVVKEYLDGIISERLHKNF